MSQTCECLCGRVSRPNKPPTGIYLVASYLVHSLHLTTKSTVVHTTNSPVSLPIAVITYACRTGRRHGSVLSAFTRCPHSVVPGRPVSSLGKTPVQLARPPVSIAESPGARPQPGAWVNERAGYPDTLTPRTGKLSLAASTNIDHGTHRVYIHCPHGSNVTC